MLKTNKIELWTSDLEYSTNIDKVIQLAVKDLSNRIIFHNNTNSTEFINIDLDPLQGLINDLNTFKWKGDYLDMTCIAKGYFIKYVIEHLPEKTMEFFINFGGDLAFNLKNEYFIPIKYNNFLISTKSCNTIFCSTNLERENHIPDAKYNYFIALADDPLVSDFVATKGLTDELRIKDCHSGLAFDKDNKLVNKCYIASPFFCETDIAIRDKMLDGFADYVRPDLLNPNIEGDLNKDENLARRIRKDNLDAINSCEVLVFPKNTTDLGTLFEVGYAIRQNKQIIRFDYINNCYEIVSQALPKVDLSKVYTLDLNKLGSGILLGFFYDHPENFKYFLGSSRDNIMLMDNEEVKTPTELYPSYLPHILSESVYRLNTLTSGS